MFLLYVGNMVVFKLSLMETRYVSKTTNKAMDDRRKYGLMFMFKGTSENLNGCMAVGMC